MRSGMLVRLDGVSLDAILVTTFCCVMYKVCFSSPFWRVETLKGDKVLRIEVLHHCYSISKA